MKKSFTKIIMSLLLLLVIPVMYSTCTVNATNDCAWVDTSRIDLSPESLLDSEYLNSQQIKELLVRCIEQSKCLQTSSINEIKFKLKHVEFFFLETTLYDSKERPLLRLWVPKSAFTGSTNGTLYTIPLEYSLRLRSDTL